jgi:hypothetical protein
VLAGVLLEPRHPAQHQIQVGGRRLPRRAAGRRGRDDLAELETAQSQRFLDRPAPCGGHGGRDRPGGLDSAVQRRHLGRPLDQVPREHVPGILRHRADEHRVRRRTHGHADELAGVGHEAAQEDAVLDRFDAVGPALQHSHDHVVADRVATQPRPHRRYEAGQVRVDHEAHARQHATTTWPMRPS